MGVPGLKFSLRADMFATRLEKITVAPKRIRDGHQIELFPGATRLVKGCGVRAVSSSAYSYLISDRP